MDSHLLSLWLKGLRFGGGFRFRLQSLGQSLGDPLHQLFHAHLDLDAGPSSRIESLLMAALHPLAAQAQAEPAARVLESRPALALVVGHTVAVLRTTALADRPADELVASGSVGGVVVRRLVAPLAVTAVWLRTVAVGGTCLLADGLTETE